MEEGGGKSAATYLSISIRNLNFQFFSFLPLCEILLATGHEEILRQSSKRGGWS